MNPLQIFISKFDQAIIVTLIILVLVAFTGFGIQSWRVAHYQAKYQLLDATYKAEIAKSKATTEKAKAEARAKEKQWAEQRLKAEQNYNAKIKKIVADNARAKSAANRLSKQLDTA